ncbi:TPA: hypothetical protein ACGO2J_002238, partial [Streptococcus suis]
PDLPQIPLISEEFLMYLEWKVYKTNGEQFAKCILESLDKKLKEAEYPAEIRMFAIIENYSQNYIPLVKKEARLECVSYLSKHLNEFSIDLIEIFEIVGAQFT